MSRANKMATSIPAENPIQFWYNPNSPAARGQVYGLVDCDCNCGSDSESESTENPLRVAFGRITASIGFPRIVFVEPTKPGEGKGFALVSEADLMAYRRKVDTSGSCPTTGDDNVEGLWVNDQNQVMVGKGRVVWAGESVHIAWVSEL
ncbi:hypothetical protein BJY01DRAFT_244885 [Aspergillus pseudoustus]|uniref:Uncharacterized protein n=1 Tax=Aspergillus pseudoustus TaxID=1810923 RepID=A0ABR4KH06_9EURO